ncbi:DUF2231 domain-containing protein [Amycolatopsis sp. NPDC059657]|uniref:DUF2231 domain-containing protein n=1 Tax=Amycolatopsis sp. NPDC059657 TaxID=3346899 RepID=UPI003671E6C2
MQYTFFGLPLHPLVIHLTVVLVPLVALALALQALVPRTRRQLRLATLAGSLVAVATVFVTTESGDRLRRQLPVNDLVERHAALGNQLRWFTIGLAVVAIVLFALTSPQARPDRVKVALVAVSVLTVLLSAVTVVQVVRIGHSGATAAWEGIANLPVRPG